MIKITTFLVVVLISLSVQSQTLEDYNTTIETIKESFNNKSSEKIHNLFTDELKTSLPANELEELIDVNYEDNGKITSLKLIVNDPESNTYLVELENSSLLFLLKLSPALKLSLFKIEEY